MSHDALLRTVVYQGGKSKLWYYLEDPPYPSLLPLDTTTPLVDGDTVPPPDVLTEICTRFGVDGRFGPMEASEYGDAAWRFYATCKTIA